METSTWQTALRLVTLPAILVTMTTNYKETNKDSANQVDSGREVYLSASSMIVGISPQSPMATRTSVVPLSAVEQPSVVTLVTDLKDRRLESVRQVQGGLELKHPVLVS